MATPFRVTGHIMFTFFVCVLDKSNPFDIEFYKRIKYNRNILLQFRSCPIALTRPNGLPNYPEIILDKASPIIVPIENQNGEYSNKYVWKSLPANVRANQNGEYSNKYVWKSHPANVRAHDQTSKCRYENYQDEIQPTSSNKSRKMSKKKSIREESTVDKEMLECSTSNGNKNTVLASTFSKDRETDGSHKLIQTEEVEAKNDKSSQDTIARNMEQTMEDNIISLESVAERNSDQGFHCEMLEPFQNNFNNSDNNDPTLTRIKDIDQNTNDVSVLHYVAKNDINFPSECGILCDNCTDEMEKAISYCTICNDFLCTICSKVHQRSKLSKHHQLLRGDDMPKEKVDLSSDELCDKHAGELKHYYCTKHNEFCCPVCVTLRHKRRCEIKHISEVADNFQKSHEYKILKDKLDELVHVLGVFKDSSEERILSKERASMEILTQILLYRSEVNEVLDKMVEAAVCKRNSVLEKYISSLKQARSRCSEHELQITDVQSRLKMLERYPQQNALVYAAKCAEKKAKECGSIIGELNAIDLNGKFKFKPNERLLEVLHSISEFGSIDIARKDSLEEIS